MRADEYATPELQTDYLLAITDLGLTPEQAEQVLALSPNEWTQVTTEVPTTLDRIMREEIRESNISLYRRRIPSYGATDLADEPAAVVTALVQALMRPNSFLNQTRTDELRAKAAEDVAVQTVTLERNEIIVRAGDVATAEQVEAMTQIGLLQDDWNWWVTLRGLLFTLVVLAVSGGALYRLRPRTFSCLQDYGLLVVVVVAVAVGGQVYARAARLAALSVPAGRAGDARRRADRSARLDHHHHCICAGCPLSGAQQSTVGRLSGAGESARRGDPGPGRAFVGVFVGRGRGGGGQSGDHCRVPCAVRGIYAVPVGRVAPGGLAQRRAVRQRRADRLSGAGQSLWHHHQSCN